MMGTSRELTAEFEHHDQMQAPITAQEIQQVIDKWPHNKSAGPHHVSGPHNGFTAIFFRNSKH
jgi:hypothetical protein